MENGTSDGNIDIAKIIGENGGELEGFWSLHVGSFPDH
jgi:hypothetical protein